jgi:hypothetical protein
LHKVAILAVAFFALSPSVSTTPPPPFLGLASCSGTQGSYRCTKDGKPFELGQLSPNDPVPKVYGGNPANVYTDPVFGTSIKRITPGSGESGKSLFEVPVYSSKPAFSKDGTYLLLQNSHGNHELYSGKDPYGWIRSLSGAPCRGSGPWNGWCQLVNGDSDSAHMMFTDDDCIYYFPDFRLMKYCVSTNRSTLVHNFGGEFNHRPVGYVYVRDYGDWSDDDKSVTVEVHDMDSRTQGFLLYDASSDSIIHSLTQCKLPPAGPGGCDITVPQGADQNSNYGHFLISPSGRYTLAGWVCEKGATCPSYRGKELMQGILANKDWTWLHDITCTGTGHADFAWDGQGNEIFVSRCDDMGSPNLRAVYTERLDNGYYLFYPVSKTWYNGDCNGSNPPLNIMHFSGIGTRTPAGLKGYILVSNTTEPSVQETNPDIALSAGCQGFGIAEEFAIYLSGVETGGPGSHQAGAITFRIAHNQTIWRGGWYYWSEAHAVPNIGFTKIAFPSSWRVDGGGLQTWKNNTVNTYVVDLQPSRLAN